MTDAMDDETTDIPPEERFGAYLQRERELRGIDLEFVARFTRLSPDRILDLEEGRWSRFSAWVYLRGAVQNYARAIGLDPHETTVRMESEVPHSDQLSGPALINQENPLFHMEPTAEKGTPWFRILLFVLVLGAVGFGYFVLREVGDGSPGRFAEEPPVPEAPGLTDGGETATAPVTGGAGGAPDSGTTATTAAVVPAPVDPGASPPPGLQERPESAAPAPPPPPSHELRIQALERSWIQYRVDGGVTQDVILPEGASQQLAATQEIRLKSGNAGGIQLFLDGTALAPLGATGQVRTRTFRFTDGSP